MLIVWVASLTLKTCYVITTLRELASETEKACSSARRQKGLAGYCFNYIDRPFCFQTDVFYCHSLLKSCLDDPKHQSFRHIALGQVGTD